MTETDDARPLPPGWWWVRFGDAADHRLGKMLDKRKNVGTPRPYLRNVNVRWHGFDLDDLKEMRVGDDEAEKYTVRRGDLVICEGGEPGRAAIWKRDEPVAYQKALHRARPREGVEAEYLLYMLEDAAGAGRLAEHFTGSTINHLTGRALAEVMVPLAPPNEQRRIVDRIEELFSDLDAGVQALEATRRGLDRYRQSVLKAAVEGALTSSWRAAHPDAEPASALLARVLEERRAGWEAEQLAKYEAKGKTPPKNWRSRYKPPAPPETEDLFEQLPASWTVTSFESLSSTLRSGGTPSTKNAAYYDGPIPFVKIEDVTAAGKRLRTTGASITDDGVENSAAWIVPEGALLYTIYGSYGLPTITEIAAATNQAIMAFLPAHDAVNLDYLYYYLLALYPSLASLTKGTTQKNLSAAIVRSLPVPLPPAEEQEAIVATVEERLSVVDAVAAEVERGLARAGRLRRAVLQRAFEGRLVPQEAAEGVGGAEAPGTQLTLGV